MKVDDTNLRLLRDFTVLKSERIRFSKSDNILEIGPPRLNGALNSPIYEGHPEWFVDLRKSCEAVGATYASLDIDPQVNPTFLGSLEDPILSLPEGQFTTVICFSILEHCQDLVTAVGNISKAMSSGSQVHFLTPWDLRFHGPRPDCWRISDDGYRWLLRNDFVIDEVEMLKQQNRELSPIAIYVCATKKS